MDIIAGGQYGLVFEANDMVKVCCVSNYSLVSLDSLTMVRNSNMTNTLFEIREIHFAQEQRKFAAKSLHEVGFGSAAVEVFHIYFFYQCSIPPQ